MEKNEAPEAVGEITVGKVKVNLIQRTLHVANELVKLTPKEFDLIALLLANLERVYTREDLLDLVWGNGLCRRYTYGRHSHAAPSKKSRRSRALFASNGIWGWI